MHVGVCVGGCVHISSHAETSLCLSGSAECPTVVFQVLPRVCEGRAPGERACPAAGISANDHVTVPSVPHRTSGSKSQEDVDTSSGNKLSNTRKFGLETKPISL